MKIIYGHLSRATIVKGTKVNTGDLMGFVGSTGESSGPHLHYEVRKNGQPIDPTSFTL
ncbi:MAG: M23 family metallopeptidase [Anaerolineales bacterium]|nr:M23 family metallopeptidase [Anaerolineales bacterium]